MKQDPTDCRIYNLEVTMDRSDDYFMWVLINEAPIANNPVNFEVTTSIEEKTTFKEMC